MCRASQCITSSLVVRAPIEWKEHRASLEDDAAAAPIAHLAILRFVVFGAADFVLVDKILRLDGKVEHFRLAVGKYLTLCPTSQRVLIGTQIGSAHLSMSRYHPIADQMRLSG